MEEQKLTEQESILLITEMISRTKRRKLDNGNIMLLWGYLSVAVATLVWVLWPVLTTLCGTGCGA